MGSPALQAHLGTWLNNVDHPYLFTWGTLRCSLDLLEHKMGVHQGHHQLMIPTWRHCHNRFPKMLIHDFGCGQVESPLTLKTGWRYSLDISLMDKELWVVEQAVQYAFKDRKFLDNGGNKATFNGASRRSFGHQGRMDPIEASTLFMSTPN